MNEHSLNRLRLCRPWQSAYAIQRDALHRFHELCADVLDRSCSLQPLSTRDLSMERNLFSTLFIMMTASLRLPESKLRFYATVNQCLRALVTGCDNILDDEYKEVISFDFPGEGIRFRSVLTIMAADAVLARLANVERDAGRLSHAKADRLLQAVLSVLVPSGLEEHEEESGLGDSVPTPDEILESVHFRKTGLLFQAPLRIVELMGDASTEEVERLTAGLTQFAAGCQILDDMKDAADDLSTGHHNLVVSLACHGTDSVQRRAVEQTLQRRQPCFGDTRRVVSLLSGAMEECGSIAASYFVAAYQSLSEAVPEFGIEEAAALGQLIQTSINKDRNDLLVKEAG